MQQVFCNTGRNRMAKSHGNSVTKLSHGFGPRSVERIAVWKCLETRRFANRKISTATVVLHHHVFTPWDSMVTSFQRLSWQIQGAACMSRVGPSSWLIAMIQRISFGLLNLSHRMGHASPIPMTPHAFTEVDVELNEIAQTVPAGFVMRVAVSTSYWPMIWPSPTSNETSSTARTTPSWVKNCVRKFFTSSSGSMAAPSPPAPY